VAALKNKFSTESIGGLSLRRVLVVVQFTVTQILVVGTFIVVSQMKFFRNVDMGFNQEAIITTDVPDRDANKRQLMQEQLKSQPFVENVSYSYTIPSGVNRNRSYQDIGKPEASSMSDYVVFEYEAIDPAYLNLYQIKLLAGRNLTDQDSVGNILINKTLMKNLNLGEPHEAVGKDLKFSYGKVVKVVGIVDDFFSNSVKEGVDNIVMLIEPESYATLSIKISATQGSLPLQDAVKGVEKVWSAAFPDFIFDYQFFDDNIRAFYAQERKYAQLFQLFSVIFLLIGCLGLYGLVTFVINRKGKEVAVRKVLGATFADILMMFSKEYVRLILISFLIAVPVAYFAVDSWLSNFAHHIALHWWLFLIPGCFVLFIALIVVTTKSIGTANANPVDRLKYE
jgi:ABC-type antimicrobial peptide transport system permease subunit